MQNNNTDNLPRKPGNPNIRNIGKRFTSEYQPNNTGKPKKLENQIKSVPKDARLVIKEAIVKAMYCKDIKDAQDILRKTGDELGPAGVCCQAMARDIAKKGTQVIFEAYKVLFGAAPIQNQVEVSGEIKGINVNVKNFKEEK